MLDAEDTHDQSLYDSLSTLDKVKKQLEKLGICDPGQPAADTPTVPVDIDSVPDHEIGNLHSQLLEFHNYATYQLALAKGREAEAENRLKYLKASIKGAMKRGEARDEELEAKPIFVVALREKQEAEQESLLIEAFKGILSKRMAVVSREVERRKLDWEKHRRTSNIRRARTLSTEDAQDRWKLGKE